jgi:HEPN domain-containing protein
VGNCYSFFRLDGIEVLKNDNSILTKLEKNVIEESENYTLRLASEIKLKQISSAWNNKEYSKFLELTDKMAKVELTEIMKKKINIAKKHK